MLEIFLRRENLKKESVWAKFAYTAADGKVYDVDYYNLDVIISVGYRVKSLRGTQFRIWASGVSKEDMKRALRWSDKRPQQSEYFWPMTCIFLPNTDFL